MKNNINSQSGLVYSTEHGRMCPGCRKPIKECQCRQLQVAAAIPPANGPVRIRRETQGRKGSGATVILGVPLDAAGLNDLAKHLKKKCGSGGTVKNGTIEIQGDHCDLVLEELKARGWNAKRAGG